ncbi:MAG TPA: hypothetical protein VG820_00450 [Fimbriimonadaceae bacterium]|nr:hypothetical protein [Fimbriimonadaceae bacterium]
MSEKWLKIRNHRYVLTTELLGKLILALAFLGLSIYCVARVPFDLRNGRHAEDWVGSGVSMAISLAFLRSLNKTFGPDSEDV